MKQRQVTFEKINKKRKNRYTTAEVFRHTWIWSKNIHQLVKSKMNGFTIHYCSGTSSLGNIKIDLVDAYKYFKKARNKNNLNPYPYQGRYNLKGDIVKLPLRPNIADTVIADPPYTQQVDYYKFIQDLKESMLYTLKPNGLFIYYGFDIPHHDQLTLKEIFLKPNYGRSFYRILSISIKHQSDLNEWLLATTTPSNFTC